MSDPNTVIITNKKRPIRWLSISKWLRYNTLSKYTEFTVGPRYYEVWFSDPNEAIIFKLKWG